MCIVDYLVSGKTTCLSDITRAGALCTNGLSVIQVRRNFLGKILSPGALKSNVIQVRRPFLGKILRSGTLKLDQP